MADENVTKNFKDLLEQLKILNESLKEWIEGNSGTKTFAKQINLTDDTNLIGFVTNAKHAVAINSAIFQQAAMRRAYHELIKTPGAYLEDYSLLINKNIANLEIQIKDIEDMYAEVTSVDNKELSELHKKFYVNSVAKLNELKKMFSDPNKSSNEVESLFDA